MRPKLWMSSSLVGSEERSSTLSTDDPMRITSPPERKALVIETSLTKVPFVDPRSTMLRRSPLISNAACRRDVW